MDNIKMASELVKTAKMLMASAPDLAELKNIAFEAHRELREWDKEKEKRDAELNKMWSDATKELNTGTAELCEDIRNELVNYFNSIGVGVRQSSGGQVGSGLVEVFLGSKDGVNRYQSKVSAHIALTFEGRTTSGFMLRNENLDETIEGTLEEVKTTSKLLAKVKSAYARGMWSEGEE